MKRVWLVAAISILLGAMTAGFGFAISPQFLGAAAPILCEPGRSFLVTDGRGEWGPGASDSAPTRMECVEPSGAATPAHVLRALLLLFGTASLAWALALWVFLGRLFGPARRAGAGAQPA